MKESVTMLIVDSDTESRNRLKQVFINIESRSDKFVFAATQEEAMARLGNSGHFDCIFVSSAFGEEGIPKILSEMKANGKSTNIPKILLLKAKHQARGYVATSYSNGFDGFICEPYSCDAVSSIIKMLMDRKSNPTEAQRKNGSVAFIIDEMIKQIDQIAYQLALGRGPGKAKKQIRENSVAIGEIAKETPDEYFKLLLRKFEGIPPPKNPVPKKPKVEKKKEEAPKKEERQQYRIIRS